jgi:CRP-like cAMP-binding protein
MSREAMDAPAPLDALRRNRLLALLEDDTLAAIAPSLSPVAMKLRDAVMTEGRPIRSALFPTVGVISMLAATGDDGRGPVEVGTIGNEGMSGVPLFLGGSRAPCECFVQVSGQAWRMPAAAFQQAAHEHRSFTEILQRYTQVLLVQASQGSACNRVHSPLQRCARWLLMTNDRVEGGTFDLVQEFLAQMLGERRPTVSRVASTLQDRRLITYSRGRITILDREGLEDTACPCYRIIRNEQDRLLSRSHGKQSVRKE